MVDRIQPGATPPQFERPENMKEGPQTRGPSSSSEPAGRVPVERESVRQPTQQTLCDLLKSLNIPSTDAARQAAAALLENGLPVTSENIDALLNLDINPRIGALLLTLGVTGDSIQSEQILGLANQSLMTGSELSDLAPLLESISSEPGLSPDTRGHIDTILASLKQMFVPLDRMVSSENLERSIQSLFVGVLQDGETSFSLARMTFLNEPALLSIIEEVGALAGIIEKELDPERGKGIKDRLRSIAGNLTKSLLGQTMTKIHLMQMGREGKSVLFAPVHWRGEPGTLVMSMDRERSRDKDQTPEGHSTTFLLYLNSLGRVKSRVSVLEKDVSCRFACEFSDLADEIRTRSAELRESLRALDLRLVDFSSETVPEHQADLFFSPLWLDSESSITDDSPVPRINIKI